jgi:hypothetical protein
MGVQQYSERGIQYVNKGEGRFACCQQQTTIRPMGSESHLRMVLLSSRDLIRQHCRTPFSLLLVAEKADHVPSPLRLPLRANPHAV